MKYAEGETSKRSYGSIDAEHQSQGFKGEREALLAPPQDQVQERHGSISSSIGILAMCGIACLLLFSGMKHSPSSIPSFLQENTNHDLLGRTHRNPEDIALSFSQRVDHLDSSNADTFQQRYYKKSKYFQGPGHPIILVVGGEGALDDGMFYPFVDTFLAERWGALVLHPEHRFYGQSQPVDPSVVTHHDLKKYHTARQAMTDMLVIVKEYQKHLGCSMDKTSKRYCPSMSVGGSYPGFLSAMMRLHYPDVIDIGYAASAPLLLYSMEADQFGYFDHVTRVTEQYFPGCAAAVKHTLARVDQGIRESGANFHSFGYKHLNICPGTIPKYIDTPDLFAKELLMVVEYTFADFNMDFYPPGNDTELGDLCQEVFQKDSLNVDEKMALLWTHLEDGIDPTLPCFDMSSQLPDGPRATISGSDWSGVGPGYDGMMFDFHCCSTLTPAVGFSKESMFPPRDWTLEWLTDHCMDRFDTTPRPYKLVDEFKFDDLVGQGASRILFTNGQNDIWSQGSYLESLSDSLLVFNIETGAHHSDLGHSGNSEREDTEEMKHARVEITAVLDGWLDEVMEGMTS